MTDLLELFARVWLQLSAIQALLFVVLLVLVSALIVFVCFALLRGMWDALRLWAHFIHAQTPAGKALARQEALDAAASEREHQLHLRRLEFERVQQWDGAPTALPTPPDIPRWLAIVGYLLGVVLGAMLATGLCLILGHAYQHGVVEFSLRSGRVAIDRESSPIAFWAVCTAFFGFSGWVAWAVFESLRGLWRRIWGQLEMFL